MLGPRDFRGLYSIIPTPTLQDATFRPGEPTADLDETARLVDALVRAGSGGIIALGTTGECATLPSWDYEPVVRCLAETVAGRVPLFVGATALGLADILSRLAVVRDAGATGTLLGMPMWQPLTTDMAVKYYATVSREFPDLAVMVYANQRAFRFPFSDDLDFWARVVDAAPTVTSAKFSRVEPLSKVLEATDGRVHFLPNDSNVVKFHDVSPGTTTACWATSASMGPEPCLAVVDAILSGNLEAAATVATDIAWTNEPVQPFIADSSVFASYNIQIERQRINEAGYCRSGPIRPPYDVVPEEYAAPSRECGRRWRQLRQKYATVGSRAERT